MKKGIKSEVGLHCLKFGKTSHRKKGVFEGHLPKGGDQCSDLGEKC